MIRINKSELVPVHLESDTTNPVGRRLSDNVKASELLNFTPEISLETGINELSRWYFEKPNKTK
jgi:nucleoside-diphosphate-sugar epimerase